MLIITDKFQVPSCQKIIYMNISNNIIFIKFYIFRLSTPRVPLKQIKHHTFEEDYIYQEDEIREMRDELSK
jgi:hypothetical protein